MTHRRIGTGMLLLCVFLAAVLLVAVSWSWAEAAQNPPPDKPPPDQPPPDKPPPDQPPPDQPPPDKPPHDQPPAHRPPRDHRVDLTCTSAALPLLFFGLTTVWARSRKQ
jgi:hypothetical protein